MGGCKKRGGGGAPGSGPHTTPKKDTRHQHALTRLMTPTGSADSTAKKHSGR